MLFKLPWNFHKYGWFSCYQVDKNFDFLTHPKKTYTLNFWYLQPFKALSRLHGYWSSRGCFSVSDHPPSQKKKRKKPPPPAVSEHFFNDIFLIATMLPILDNDIEAQIHDPGGIQQVSIGKSWRDLIPVIKVDISSVRAQFTTSICGMHF